MGATQAKMLPMEAMGTIRLPAIAKAGRECETGLEHMQVGSWSVAFEPKPGPCHGPALEIFQWPGSAEFSGSIMVTQSTEPPWYVIRMPGGVGGEAS